MYLFSAQKASGNMKKSLILMSLPYVWHEFQLSRFQKNILKWKGIGCKMPFQQSIRQGIIVNYTCEVDRFDTLSSQSPHVTLGIYPRIVLGLSYSNLGVSFYQMGTDDCPFLFLALPLQWFYQNGERKWKTELLLTASWHRC